MVPVTGQLVPDGSFPILDSADGVIGGSIQVADHATRNAIPSYERRQGMFVWCNNTTGSDGLSGLWQLTAASGWTFNDSDWTDPTVVSANSLIGNPTGSSASAAEISLGANLSFVGGQLTAAGGGPTAPAPMGSYLISGGGVAWSTSGLGLIVSAATYSIRGVIYSSPQTTVTLAAADATHARYDAIVVDSAGTAYAVTGTPASTPLVPIADPSTQLALTSVSIPATNVVPANITSTLLFDEDTGPSSEWTAAVSAGTLVPSSTSNPYHGTHCLEGTAVANLANFSLSTASPVNPALFNALVFYVKPKAYWGLWSIELIWYRSGTQVGQVVALQDGSLGFSSAATSSYQQIVVPLSSFAFPGGATLDELIFWVVSKQGGTIGFYLDYVQLQTQGDSFPSIYTTTVSNADGTLVFSPTSGNVVGSIAAGGVGTTQLATNAVTYAKMQSETAHTLLGNPTGSGGVPSEITLGSGLAFSGSTLTATGGGSGTVTSIVAGTGLTGGTITSSGTIALSSPVSAANGGTGVANSSTITIGGNVTFSGAYTFAGTLTAATAVTFPTSGTLITSSVTALSSLVTVGTIGTGTWQGTAVGAAYGGTGNTTNTAHAVMLGEGTSAVGFATIGTAGRVLTDKGASADPAFASTQLQIDSHQGVITADTDGSTITFDCSVSDWHKVTLGGNRTLALSNVGTNQQVTIVLIQDGSGSRTVTWFSTIKWPGGTVPTLSTAAGAIDVFTFKQISSGNYYGFTPGQAMA